MSARSRAPYWPWIISIGVAVAATAFAWRLRGSASPQDSPVAPASHEVAARLERHSNQLEAPPTIPASRTETLTSESTVTTHSPASPVRFEDRYSGKTMEELASALAVVSHRRLELQKKITQEREEAGLFVKVRMEPGKVVDLSQVAIPEVDQRFPRPQRRVSQHVRGGNGRDHVEVSGFPSGEYPEFDSLADEELWLQTALHAASQSMAR